MEYLVLVAGTEKPRIFQGGRDMMISLAIVAVLMVVVVAGSGLVSFNPGRPDYGPVREVDAQSFVEMEARSVDYPVVYPDVPGGWIPNSARRSHINGTPAPIVGWFTANEGFVDLTQTPLPMKEAVEYYDGSFRPDQENRTVAGSDVQIYSSSEPNVRSIWVFDLGVTRAIISGAARDEDFVALTEATLKATPVDTAVPLPEPKSPAGSESQSDS